MAVRRILFICMGNICRSPLAEGVFRAKVERRGLADAFEIDSAGTGDWHAGELPDPRMRALATVHGIRLDRPARQVTEDDFERFDLILCADRRNRDDLSERGAPPDKVRLLLELDPESSVDEVPDPYYGAESGFELVYELVDRACEHLVDRLARDLASGDGAPRS